MGTKIEWADDTINPIIGCSKCSPGCDNCYAERMAARLAKMPATALKYSTVVVDGKWNGAIQVNLKDAFKGLSSFGKPKRVFVGSMGDVFHENTPIEALIDLFRCFTFFPHHTFLLLTKRPEQMRSFMIGIGWAQNNTGAEDGNPFIQWPLPNVWLGVTAENQAMADRRIPILLSTPAAKRFVSIEPMLGPVDLRPYDDFSDRGHGPAHLSPSLNAAAWPGLNWVIVGGETGRGARPMDADWARQVRDQCKASGVPYFFKQMTKKSEIPDDLMVREMPA